MSDDGYPVSIEFVEGPYDGKVITIEDPGDAAPSVIRMGPSALTGQEEYHEYRAPESGEETEEAVAAFAEDKPIKYRYTGKVTR